jgi:hypothetical protein
MNIRGQTILPGKIKLCTMSELYNEKINEFVDWVDGTNCLTHNIETLNAEG